MRPVRSRPTVTQVPPQQLEVLAEAAVEHQTLPRVARVDEARRVARA